MAKYVLRDEVYDDGDTEIAFHLEIEDNGTLNIIATVDDDIGNQMIVAVIEDGVLKPVGFFGPVAEAFGFEDGDGELSVEV